MLDQASAIADKAAAVVHKMVAKEVADIIESERRVSLLIERDKSIDREIMNACIEVGIAVDKFKQAKFTGGSAEIRAREKLEREADRLQAILRQHKKMPR